MARWFAVSIPPSPISSISPHVISPQPPHPLLSLPLPPTPQPTKCVIFPSLCPCVLFVQHPLMSENMWCLAFCSCVSLLRRMVFRFIHVPPKAKTNIQDENKRLHQKVDERYEQTLFKRRHFCGQHTYEKMHHHWSLEKCKSKPH